MGRARGRRAGRWGGGAAGGSRQDRQEEGPSDPVPKSPGELGELGVLPSPAPYTSRHKELFPSFPTPQRACRPVVQGQRPALLLPACPVLADKGVRREGVPSPQRAPTTPSRARPFRRGRSPGTRRGPRHQSPARGGGAPAAEARRWTMWTRGPNSRWAATRPGDGDCDRPTWAGAAGGRRLVNDNFTGNTRASPPFSFRTLISMFREERRPHGVDAGERPGAVWSPLSMVGWIPTLAGGGGSPGRPLHVLRGPHGST